MALDLPLNPDQQLLQDSLRRFLADVARPGWRDLSDTLALGGVTAPEAAGGFGGAMCEVALVAAELGPALAGSEWLAHAVATWLLAAAAPGHEALADLAAGRRRAAILCPASTAKLTVAEDGATLHGTASLAAGAAEADLFVLATDATLFCFAADHGTWERQPRAMRDGSITADLRFACDALATERLGDGLVAATLSARANDMMLTALCAETVALIGRMVADSADFLGQRKQFGKPIATFQVLRHRMADMQLALIKATALTEVAILAVEQDRPDRAHAVSAACVEVGDAARTVGESAVQLHGAMGLTEELDLGHRFRRALTIAAAMGPRQALLRRFVEAGG